MELIITTETSTINTDAIGRGCFIRAKYKSWTEARNGLVATATRDEIRVIWEPSIRNVTNYFTITAEEIAAGLWTVAWSADMETIHTHDPDAGSGDGDGDSGGGP